MSSPTLQGGVRSVSVWSQARADCSTFGKMCFILVRAACVFGRLPGNSLRFLPPTQAPSEQKEKMGEFGGISADATFSPSAVRVSAFLSCKCVSFHPSLSFKQRL